MPVDVVSGNPPGCICRYAHKSDPLCRAEATEHVEFVVPGEPVGQGSMIGRAVGKRVLLRASNESNLRRHRKLIFETAGAAGSGRLWTGPVMVVARFYMPRPKAHLLRGELRDSAPRYHSMQKNDVDKLLRAVLDGITGALLDDDGRVAVVHGCKLYADPKGPGPRTVVTVSPLHGEEVNE